MKKLILLFIILTLTLSGCWVTPDDYSKFIATVEKLDTPQKIGDYMLENFIYETNSILLDPYQLFLIKRGNCDDFSLFATSIANYHGYETYQILAELPLGYHMIGVFKEGNYYNISENTLYIECFCENFKEIMNFYLYHDWISYKVYDYNMNLIEQN
ncbi:hypothetical protein ES705_30411 [subsurface metagenome]